jgi:tetratricopeptide (TPR) repeat protein
MSDAMLWNEIGNIYRKIGLLEDSIAAYTKAIDLDPDSGWSYCNLGHAYFLTGEFGQALFQFRKSIQLLDMPENQAVVWNKIGDAYRALKDIDNAILAYKKADDLDMGASLSEQNKGKQRVNIANLREMIEKEGPISELNTFPPPHKIPPLDEPTLTSYSPLNEIPPARVGKEILEKSANLLSGTNKKVELHPIDRVPQDEPELLTNSTKVDMPGENRGEKSKGHLNVNPSIDNLEEILAKINIYENITRVNPTSDRAWDTLGKLYKSLGRYKDAIGAYQKAIELVPDREVYYYYLGLLFSVEQQHDEAVRAFQFVLHKNPDYVLAHSALAGVYHRMGLENKANHHIATALPKMNNESAYNRACFYAICGDIELAFEFLRLALMNKDTTIEWIKSDPDLDPIRTDPRFQELILEQDQPGSENANENYFSSEMEGKHNRLLPILNHSLTR